MKNKSSAVALLCFAALCAAADLPVITAHRGGRLEYDDNALGTFKQSVARGVRRFETDIRYTKDHRFAIMHDDTLDRTTTGKGYLEDRTIEELRAIRLRKSGEPIPTPEEILDVVASVPDSFIELELKTYNHRKNAPKFYTDDLVREYCEISPPSPHPSSTVAATSSSLPTTALCASCARQTPPRRSA